MNSEDTQTTGGGSRATDFQPPTQNPQGNVGGGLQQNSAALQPVTTSNGSNVFNQPGVNAQAFPQTTVLKVQNSGSGISMAQPINKTTQTVPILLFIVIVTVLAGIVLIIVKNRKPSLITTDELNETIPATIIPAQTKPKKKKKSSKPKKKSSKKKK